MFASFRSAASSSWQSWIPALAFVAVIAAPLPLAAQSSACSQNLVQNGDFYSPLPPWSVSGNVVTAYPTDSVDGVTTSRCIQLTGGNWSLVSPSATPVTLGTGSYEVSFNMLRSGMDLTLEVGVTPVGGSRVLLYRQFHTNRGSAVRSRIAIPFASPGAGDYLIDITVGTFYSGTPLRIDDVVLHPARPLFFTVEHDGRRTGTQNAYRVRGAPNQMFAVLVAFGSTAPVAFPLCAHDLMIGPLPNVAVQVDLSNLDPSGVRTGTFSVPAIAAGWPLWWQPIALTPGCEFGCADMIAFQ